MHKQTGIDEEAARRTAEMAVDAGLDAIHVSAYADPRSGIAFTDAPLPHEPCAYLELAAGVKRRIDVPVIAVGRIEPAEAEAAIAEGKADFIAMGRKLIADPELPNKLAERTEGAVRPCLYAYRCVGNVFLREASTCVANPAAGREDEREIVRAPVRRKVLVAGGGPAGLETARVLRLRGHDVVLCERKQHLGGLAVAAGEVEPTNRGLVPHLESEVRRLGVDIHLECVVTPELAADFEPDAIVVAIGAWRGRDHLAGADADHVFGPDALSHGTGALLERGRRIVVVGGDLIGLGAALHLADAGAEVTVLEPSGHFALAMSPPRRWRALHFAKVRGIALIANSRAQSIEKDGVRWLDSDGADDLVECDTVLVTTGMVAWPRLAEELSIRWPDVRAVGDCTGLSYFEGALAGALDTARTM